MIAIIPARGGSKGLPGKNIKKINGLPLIGYSIKAAQESNLISRIIVSTDDEQIAMISRELGAEVPGLRPADLAQDDSKAIDVYRYTIKLLEEKDSSVVSNVIILQPTSPLRTVEDIDKAIRLFELKEAYSVISMCEADKPIEWAKEISSEGIVKQTITQSNENRQEYSKKFYPNGAVFVFSREAIESGEYYSSNTFGYVMERKRSLDIDDQFDFDLAKLIIENKL